MEAPSLAMIPTGFKDGKLYSVLPESGVGDFDVVRGSGATRVNKDGLVVDVRNLSGELVTNGDFSNGSTDWDLGTGWSVLDGKAVADGTTNNAISQTTISSAVGKSYKIDFTIADYVTGNIRIYFGGVFTSFVSDNGNYSFQVEATAVDALATSASGLFNGSIDNISVKEVTDDTDIPRLDYTGGGCPSLLLEPQSTNLITHSSDFSDASWDKVDSSVLSNQGIAPDGTNNATLYTATTGEGRLRTNITHPSTIRTFSIWVKSHNSVHVNGILTFSGLNTASFTTTDEWQRITTTRDVAGDTFKCSLRTTDSLLVWGGQLEALSYATSYIPTSGVIATRLADKVTGAGDVNTFNSTEGVLYFEGAALFSGSNTQISLSDGTDNNSVILRFDLASDRISSFLRGNGGTFTIKTLTGVTQTDNNKIALVWNATNFRIWFNGVEAGTIATNDLPIGLNTLNFAQPNGISDSFYGKVKDFRTYNTALTDSELTELTTI